MCTRSVTILWLATSFESNKPAAPGKTPPSIFGAIPPVTISATSPRALVA